MVREMNGVESPRRLYDQRAPVERASISALNSNSFRRMTPCCHYQRALARRESGEALVDIARSYAVSHSRLAGCSAGLASAGRFKGPPRNRKGERDMALRASVLQ